MYRERESEREREREREREKYVCVCVCVYIHDFPAGADTAEADTAEADTSFAGLSRVGSGERGPLPLYRASSNIIRCPSLVSSIFCQHGEEIMVTRHKDVCVCVCMCVCVVVCVHICKESCKAPTHLDLSLLPVNGGSILFDCVRLLGNPRFLVFCCLFEFLLLRAQLVL